MKLIVIYGPPAVGKFTVAKELAKITKYKLFHNHLVFDLVNSLFEIGDTLFVIGNKIKLELLEAAAREKLKGVIITFCYVKGDMFVKEMIERVKKHKVKLCFVHLQCKKDELFKRTKHPFRKKFHKIRSIKELRYILKKYDYFSKIPFVKSLSIDNTKIFPKKAALKIKKHFKL